MTNPDQRYHFHIEDSLSGDKWAVDSPIETQVTIPGGILPDRTYRLHIARCDHYGKPCPELAQPSVLSRLADRLSVRLHLVERVIEWRREQ